MQTTNKLNNMNKPENEQLESKLRKIEVEKQGNYDKRTEHLDDRGRSIFINRLILEDSPYLLQHAHNPVNWYAWGEEAFADAKQQGKPVFLSIGYSTCHWCHVMEVESFDNIAVAEVLNKHFISIKMDREQYPDIDEVYMTGVQLMSGQGGWPMSNFLLADGKPFFAATYFPAANFIALLQQIVDAWAEKRGELETSATKISESIDRLLSDRTAAAALQPQVLENTLQALMQREDRSEGGLAGAPKFPQEPLLLLMLDSVRRHRNLDAMGFVDRALEGMARGGIYDQVAGGFHRYSVDAQWLVPHFEKMLYNQSQLGLVYLQAYQLTGNAFFKRVCEQTLDYVLREMQLPDGGFYSATDADSEGEEGTFFTWTIEELKAVLDSEEQEFVIALFGMTDYGNFEGSNILNLSKSLTESLTELLTESLTESTGESRQNDFTAYLDDLLSKLYQAREQRIHPLRDDKLIISWSAAMITTLTRAAYLLDRQDWLAAAERAAQFMWINNVAEDGQLNSQLNSELNSQLNSQLNSPSNSQSNSELNSQLNSPSNSQLKRIYLDGTVSIAGQLEDYANFTEALINLFDATGNGDYLQQAAQLMEMAVSEFWDEANGGFYLSPSQQTGPQLTRSRNASDGATLSAVGGALQCLLKLNQRHVLMNAQQDMELTWREKADACIASLIASVNDNPMSHSSVLRAIIENEQGSLDVIQYSEGGRAKISANKIGSDDESSRVLEFSISLQADWHATAGQKIGSELMPIQLSVAEQEMHWRILNCSYPETITQLKHSDGSLIAIYENDFVISVELERVNDQTDFLSASAGISLRLQLCNEKHCLLPQTLNFRI